MTDLLSFYAQARRFKGLWPTSFDLHQHQTLFDIFVSLITSFQFYRSFSTLSNMKGFIACFLLGLFAIQLHPTQGLSVPFTDAKSIDIHLLPRANNPRPNEDPNAIPTEHEGPGKLPGEGVTTGEPVWVDRPESGAQLIGNLRYAIKNDKPDVDRSGYEASYERDIVAATSHKGGIPGMADKKDQFSKQGIDVSGGTDNQKWTPAVLAEKNHPWKWDKDGNGDWVYLGGIPDIEIYHDTGEGIIAVKIQMKIEDTTEHFSDIAFQLWKEDQPAVQDLKKVVIMDISNEYTIEALEGPLKGVDKDLTWKNLEYDSDEFKAVLASPNGKWLAWMLTDHHQAFGDLEILDVQVAGWTIKDETWNGYLVFNVGKRS